MLATSCSLATAGHQSIECNSILWWPAVDCGLWTVDSSADGRRSAAIFATVELPSAEAYRLTAFGAITYQQYELRTACSVVAS